MEHGGVQELAAEIMIERGSGGEAAWLECHSAWDSGFAHGLTPMQCGSRELQLKYLCLAEKEAGLQRLLTPQLENALLALPPKLKPVIKLKPDGLEIVLNGVQVTEPSDLRAIVSLGKALVEA